MDANSPWVLVFGLFFIIMFILAFIRIIGIIGAVILGLWLFVGRIKNKITLALSLGNGEELDRDTIIRLAGLYDPIVGGIVGHKKSKPGPDKAPAEKIEPKF